MAISRQKKHTLAGSAPMVVGGGTLLVPKWLRGLVQTVDGH